MVKPGQGKRIPCLVQVLEKEAQKEATRGIQKGHMALHARNIASAAGAPSTLVPEVRVPLNCAPVCVLCVSYASFEAPANEMCGIR